MALITDPDFLSQGTSTTVSDAVWGSPTSFTVTITSAGTNLPPITSGDYFEVRDHSNSVNNGLYKSSGTPSTGSITATKVTGSAPQAATSESVAILGNNSTTIDKKSVHYDTSTRKIYLLENGNLSTDGVSLQALYSFTKEEWKNDSTLIPHPFPFTAITPEQFEFNYDWAPTDVASPVIQTRKLIRTGGWREYTTANVLNKEYAGIVTLGQFEDNSNDQAYYQVGSDPTDTSAGVAFTFNGPVNEAINTYNLNVGPNASLAFSGTTITRGAGSWVTDGYKKGSQVTITNAEDSANNGTYVITAVTSTVLTITGTTFTTNADDDTATLASNYRNAVKIFLRIRDGDTNGKTFAQSQLSDIGVTAVDNKVFRFPVSNATDLKIEETDVNIAANSPYTSIVVKYFDQAFTQDVDTPGTGRNFGIVIDVGTHSGVDGSCSSGGTTFTTSEAGITGANYTGGTLIIHEGLNKGTYTISGTPTSNTVTITGSTFPSTVSNQSFTLQRATPVVATAEEIYEKVQYLLRQASDIDTTDQTVTGKTADALLRFVGDTLEAGQAIPSNPNGGGSGVNIQGFSSNDTNRITLYDNTGTSRTFPFVAAGTINFNTNLVSDGSAKYWMFFEYTERFTNTGFSIGSASGSSATLSSSTTNLVSELASGDYIKLAGFATSVNNGIYVLTAAPSGSGPYTVAVRKINGDTLVNEAAGATVSLDKNPINTPDAITVQDTNDADISGVIGGSTVSFTFDYDGNVQGGRSASTDAAVYVRAIGLNTAQFVETTATITRATGQSISLVASLERNYSS